MRCVHTGPVGVGATAGCSQGRLFPSEPSPHLKNERSTCFQAPADQPLPELCRCSWVAEAEGESGAYLALPSPATPVPRPRAFSRWPSHPNWKMRPFPFARASVFFSPPLTMLLGKSSLHLPLPRRISKDSSPWLRVPHTHTLPSTGPSRGTTPGGAVRIAVACRVRTAFRGEGCAPPAGRQPHHPRLPGQGTREDWPAKVSCVAGPASRPSERASESPRPVRLCPPRPGPPRASLRGHGPAPALASLHRCHGGAGG